jgi:hypothetical protein
MAERRVRITDIQLSRRRMDKDIRGGLFQSVIDYARANHASMIEQAYEYFWEEDDPQEMLGGTALTLAFINFEDWFVCDYRNKDGDSIIDLYVGAGDELPDEDIKALEAMRDSFVSLYEVVSTDGEVTLKDILLDEKFPTKSDALSALNPGDIFAARFVEAGGERIMSRCVYPFTQGAKDRLLEFVDQNFKRYGRKKPEGTMRDFVKDESYIFNLLWLDNIFKTRRAN